MMPLLYLLPLLSHVICLTQGYEWIHELRSEGFTVQKGLYGFFDTDTCSHSDTCYAINPLTPYGLFFLPPHPNETTHGNYTNTCHRHNMCRIINGTQYAPSWRIAEGEVVALIGRTPPKSTYWSFSNYLYTRFHGPSWRSYSGPYPNLISNPNPSWRSNASLGRRLIGCEKPGPTGDRCEVFATGINESLNVLTLTLL